MHMDTIEFLCNICVNRANVCRYAGMQVTCKPANLQTCGLPRYAYAPELAGCQTQGDSLDEALANIREAVELYLETMTPEEIKESLSQAVLTTTLEVAAA